ncbi:MAG: hypothetical protein LBT10_07745 [Methanobrevibacter sp.]|jgi:hypothetical protein|nr:hypothetical protein [Methanobrevibacter sp.]
MFSAKKPKIPDCEFPSSFYSAIKTTIIEKLFFMKLIVQQTHKSIDDI